MSELPKTDASTVLIVDDSQANLRLAAKFLEAIGGYQPVLVSNPARVLGIACRVQPEAVLMDIMMPELDGYEVCRQLKQVPSLADVPVIFVTAKEDEASIGKAFEAGGVDYVVKPLDGRALGVRLRVHIDHYRARRELQRSEARLRDAQATARLADWQLDVGRAVFLGSPWTFKLCRLVGTPSSTDAVLHAPVSDLLACIAVEHRERLQQILRCQPGQGEREARCRSVVDGSLRQFHFVAHAEADGDGTRVVGTVQDVTERFAALESLRRAEQRLMESKRIEAVGRLAGGVAHEFNNLLQAILGYSSMLARRLDDGSAERGLVTPILTAGGRARELVNQILLVGRQGSFAPQALELCSFATRFVPTVETVLHAPSPITVACQSVPEVWADPGLLEHVLMNLCQNALQATATAGSVTVTVDSVVLESVLPAAGSVIPAGQHIRLAVSDTGVGIPADALERVLEPFFTTRPVGKGSGLGLSAVQGVVRQHQGHLVLASAPGQGTTVSVYLAPYQSESAGAGTVAQASPLCGRALVVAADELIRGILALHLGDLGCEVWAVARASEASPLLGPGPEAVDVLAVDLSGLSADEQGWLGEVAERLPVLGVLGDGSDDGEGSATLFPMARPVTVESLRQGLIWAARA